MVDLDKLEFKVSDEWEKASKENYWIVFIPEYAVAEDGTEYMRRKDQNHIFKMERDPDNKNSYMCICTVCNTIAEAATIAHPIHDGPFPGSGSGKCEYEYMPYCPKCEEKPSSSGLPISVGKKFR